MLFRARPGADCSGRGRAQTAAAAAGG